MLRRVILLGYLTASAFFIAHLINAVVVHKLVGPVEGGKAMAAMEPRALSKLDLPRLAQETMAGDLFSQGNASGMSAFEIVGGGPSGPGGSQPGSSLSVAKKVKLIGTVVAEGIKPLAIIQSLKPRKQALYHLYDTIPDVGEIRIIERDAVVIQRGGQREILGLETQKRENQSPSRPVGSSVQKAGSSPIHRILDRREVAQHMANLPKLLSQARAVAHFTDGKLDGWRLAFVKPKSFYDEIGLRQGDILKRVNGVEIRDPGMILTLFQQAQFEREISLDLLRENETTTLAYEIR